MTEGDKLRQSTGDNGILAYGATKKIKDLRKSPNEKTAFIINSLKHPDEVEVLRKIYGQGFYLVGIHADVKRRLKHLTEDKNLSQREATELTEIDEDEKIPHGQRTKDTYHLADFFLSFGKNADYIKNTIQRFLDLIFSNPYLNPTFDEFAMFMAFSSSVRSGDLSRQVGAVIASKEQIMSTGANECPSAGGGLYWAKVDENGMTTDAEGGKDFTRQEDSNKAEQAEIIEEILQGCRQIDRMPEEAIAGIETALRKSRISDLTVKLQTTSDSH
jgi:deoxycytidylate deaminase